MAVVKDWPEPMLHADEGISGTKQSRPELDRLLADVEAGLIDAVIIVALDRLGRNTRLTRDLVARITRHTVAWVAHRLATRGGDFLEVVHVTAHSQLTVVERWVAP
jgi:DNA invertase Pin-like site-specific DNA recombinase